MSTCRPTWTSSLTHKPPRRQWFRLVLPFSSTFIMDQILCWGEICYMFSRKVVAGVIKPETLPPTKGAAAQHALCAYTCRPGTGSFYRESLNPSDYEWTLGVHGYYYIYEPVPTLDPMASEGLLKFTSCNCHGDCSNWWCSCKKNGVMCISVCGVCKDITCKNSSNDVVESEEDRQWLLKLLAMGVRLITLSIRPI